MEQMDAESIMPMLEVHEDYLARALDAIEQKLCVCGGLSGGSARCGRG